MTAVGARRSPRTRSWGLLLSIALNVFLVALVVSHVVVHWSDDRRHGIGPRIDRMAATLPAADGEKLRSAFAAHAGDVTAATAAYREAQAAMRQALGAEPFDPAALRAAMTEARTKRLALEQAIQDAVATAAATMSSKGRAKLAERPRGK